MINLAGIQRMLSQRIAEDALELSTADKEQRGPLLERMRGDTDQMERAHKVLRDGDITLGIAPPSTTALQAVPSHRSVIVLDIDNSKSINDQFGHMIGDHAIQNAVRLIWQTSAPAITSDGWVAKSSQ